MSLLMWIGWALLCIAQNFAFTFVSRARNSGSLRKHLIAGLFSNGIWFVGQLFAVSAFMGILAGHFGVGVAIFAGAYYTVFTLAGSIAAHQYALWTERGTSRVGAHKDIATFTAVEGEALRKMLLMNNVAPSHSSPVFSEAEAEILRTRTLVCDTGDGIGTFTTAEIGTLKELAGTKLEVVDELVMESSQWQPSPSLSGPVTYAPSTGNVSTMTPESVADATGDSQ